MAECASLPSNFKLRWRRRSCANDTRSKSWTSFVNYSARNCTVAPASLWRIYKHNSPFPSSKKYAHSPGGIPFTCSCWGALIESESAAASDWVSVVDQVLLMASIFLTYMAGVIPSRKSYVYSQENIKDELHPDSTIIPGSSLPESGEEMRPNCTWDTVKKKLSDSLQVTERGNALGRAGTKFAESHGRQALSLDAVSDGPRLRLLLLCLGHLEKEVNNLADSSIILKRAEWLMTFYRIMQKVPQQACVSWIQEEFVLKGCKPDTEIVSPMSVKLNGDIILRNIRRLGKVDLYADFLYFLRHGPVRECCHYDHSLYVLHGVNILEDLVITSADGIASIYLELISVDSDISDKMPNLGFALCSLSTRALQKLRNEVAMRQWFSENVEAVVSMYEDRFDLYVLRIQLVEGPVKDSTKMPNWWRKFSLGRSAIVQSQQQYAMVTPFSLPVKRTKELRALTGWRYYFSLLLELSDILMPIAKAAVAQVRNAISFFLVSLIGRSLGLIYTGIRQCLPWK